MQIINCTDHDCRILHDDAPALVIPRSNEEARMCAAEAAYVTVALPNDAWHRVQIFGNPGGHVTGLPDRQAGTLYLVSMEVLDAALDREDLVAEDLVRDEAGEIFCRGLRRSNAGDDDYANHAFVSVLQAKLSRLEEAGLGGLVRADSLRILIQRWNDYIEWMHGRGPVIDSELDSELGS